MKKGNIYWLTGSINDNRNILSKWLVELLQTDKRNWRKTVFYLNESTLPSLSLGLIDDTSTNYKNIQLITNYLHQMGCDVVVSTKDTNPIELNSFKNTIDTDYFNQFHLTMDGNQLDSDSDVIEINIQKVKTEKSFTKIVNHLKDINKL